MYKKEIKIQCDEVNGDYLHVYLDTYDDLYIEMNIYDKELQDNLIIVNKQNLANLVDFLIEVQNNE